MADEVNNRGLQNFVYEIYTDTPSDVVCGLQCISQSECKSFNHNEKGTTCELIMTDYRLLEKPRGQRSTKGQKPSFW